MTQRHGETDRSHEGFEATLERGFEWLEANVRLVLIVLVGAVVVGGASAAAYEWSKRQGLLAQIAFDRVEQRFYEAMGSDPRALFITEPANEERAERAREEALAGFEAVIAEHTGSFPAEASRIRAAEIEIGLGRLDAAEARLDRAAEELAPDSLLRAVALRLRGYALEELGRFDEAAEAYERGGAVAAYPAREALWLAAGENHLRAGDGGRAIAAFREILALAPAYAEREGLVERLAAMEYEAEPSAADPERAPTPDSSS